MAKDKAPERTTEERGADPIIPARTSVAPVDGSSKAIIPRTDVGGGFEDMDQSELAIPFIVLLQKNSKQCEEGSGKYVPGAAAGKYMNSVTLDLYEKATGVVLVPALREHKFIEWIPRDNGGGFVAAHDPLSPFVIESRAGLGPREPITTKDGNNLVETYQMYCLHVKPDGSFDHVMTAFAKTFIGSYRNWMTKARSQTQLNEETKERESLPLWAHRYLFTSQFNENKKGTWYKPLISFDGGSAERARLNPGDELYEAAKTFRSLIESGVVKPQMNTVQDSADAAEEGGDPDKF